MKVQLSARILTTALLFHSPDVINVRCLISSLFIDQDQLKLHQVPLPVTEIKSQSFPAPLGFHYSSDERIARYKNIHVDSQSVMT